MLLATFSVTNSGDSGAGSLRQAIIDSNTAGGSNTIQFSIGTQGSPQTISPLSALPTVTATVLIDGWSQGGSGYTGAPLVTIDGTTGGLLNGLSLGIAASGSTVRGIVVNNMSNAGIVLGGSSDSVQACYIGTNSAGTIEGSITILYGIDVAANGAVIGTNGDGVNDTVEGNLLSGNFYGVFVEAGVSNTVVAGNRIGTDAPESEAIPNAVGVAVSSASSSGTRIGTDGNGASDSAERNIISGNNLAIDSSGTSTVVAGNYIGINAAGTAFGNGSGVLIDTGAVNNRVGVNPLDVDAAADANVISGNGTFGIEVIGPVTTGTTIAGNLIGLAVNGGTALANSTRGIWLRLGSTGTTIGGTSALTRNVISGNIGPGIEIGNSGASGNLIEGNYIGTNAAGTAAVANTGNGVVIENGPANTTVGGTTAGAGNVISGNAGSGIDIFQGTNNTVIQGNAIGLNAAGTSALGNGNSGIDAQPVNGTTIIGGTLIAARNVISGNSQYGIQVRGTMTIEGNYIGTDGTGSLARPNQQGGLNVSGNRATVIGGPTATPGTAAGNVISGNAGPGIELASSVGASVQGNLIGTNALGTAPLANTVGITVDSSNNTIGGDDAADGSTDGLVKSRNVISGNTGDGIYFDPGLNSSANLVEGNYIGVGLDGATPVANAIGVVIQDQSSDQIGGTTAGASNVISSNTGDGVDINWDSLANLYLSPVNNVVEGNLIGLSASGPAPAGNGGSGVLIEGTASGETVGGNSIAARNVISGNAGSGVNIASLGAKDGTVGWWRGEQSAADVFGQDDGVLQNGATYGPGVVQGYAFQFDGIDDYFEVPDGGDTGNADLDLFGDLTLEAWVRFDTAGPGDVQRTIFSQSSSDGQDVTYRLEREADGELGFTSRSGGGAFQTALSGATLGANQWYHVAATLQGTTLTFYLNGVAVDTTTYSSSRPDTFEEPFTIGAAVVSGSVVAPLMGRVDEPAVYDRALSASEISDLYGRQSLSKAGNAVEGNYIGTNAGATAAVGNTSGVLIHAGSSGNTIGGTAAGAGNVISGNSGNALEITDAGTANNQVAGNYIGTNAAGTASVGNTLGVLVQAGAIDNTIGGTTAAARNLISGTTSSSGVDITGSGTTGNVVEGNYIGLGVNGLAGSAITNNGDGIKIDTGAGANTIGGTTAAAGNIISSNANAGVEIDSATSQLNVVQGNAIVNNVDGVLINGASSNTIGGTTAGTGNEISKNQLNGILLEGGSNLIAGNIIGIDLTDSAAPNQSSGIYVTAANNTIGGNTASARNVISSNVGAGIALSGGAATGNTVAGNYIGVDALGASAIANAGGGVVVNQGASNNTLGGTTASALNVISGNTGDGVLLTDTGTNNNVIEGNLIGLAANGATPRGNTEGVEVFAGPVGTVIGGTVSGAGNVISSNTDGVFVHDSTTVNVTRTLIAGNLIGTDITGALASGNSEDGVLVRGSAGTTIGGTTSATRNVISGSGRDGVDIDSVGSGLIEGNYIGLNSAGTSTIINFSAGISMRASSTVMIGGTSPGAGNVIAGTSGAALFLNLCTGISVQANLIGTNPGGTAGFASTRDGVTIQNSSGNTIGGTTAAAKNIISAAYGDGLRMFGTSSNNLVEGNYFGLDANGTNVLPNGLSTPQVEGNFGIRIDSGASGNTIGGAASGAGNVVSGNIGANIEIDGSGTSNNQIQGNYIGTNAAGSAAVANGSYGVEIATGASSDTVGGAVAGSGNVISGNSSYGIYVTAATSITISGNFVGTNTGGTAAIPNQNGIYVNAGTATIGGLTAAERNVVSGNTGFGIEISGGTTAGNIVEGNFIGTDSSGASAMSNGNEGVIIITQQNVVIGGSVAGAGNVISGNQGAGIDLNVGTSNNAVQGNIVGLNAAGSAKLANSTAGIVVNSSSNNTIGGTTALARNVISGNGGEGIGVDGTSSAAGNLIEGNYIGWNAAGTAGIGDSFGIFFDGRNTATIINTTIGGTTAGSGNLIAGSAARAAVYFSRLGTGSTGNVVQGNLIGINAAGTIATSGTTGVETDTSTGVTIGGTSAAAANVISGTGIGVWLTNSSTGIVVEGNVIGLNAGGTAAVANGISVLLNNAATNNTIGGTTAAARNVISGSNTIGVELSTSGTTGNLVEGNYIGTNPGGTAKFGNATGVQIDTSASGNTIGGLTATPGTGAGNVISGNSGTGVDVTNSGTTDNTIEGNLIGTNAAGTAAVANSGKGVYIESLAAGNLIGGSTSSARNVISGNGATGIEIDAASTFVQGNYIGVDASGNVGLPNLGSGILIQQGDETIGGVAASPGLAPGNVISANVGVGIEFNNSTANTPSTVASNVIGLGADGSTPLGNSSYGIYVALISPNVMIGGATAASRNIISANTSYGIITDAGATGLVVQSNYIGTDVSGMLARGNTNTGISIGASGALIGGPTLTAGLAPGNVISANGNAPSTGAGVIVSGDSDVIQGNIIGLKVSGSAAVNNFQNTGVWGFASTNLTVGGTANGAGNLIGANVAEGVLLSSGAIGTVVQGNFIGTNTAGTPAIANGFGVLLNTGATNNTIGGTTSAAGNVISGNTTDGVELSGSGTSGNTVEGNYIGTNAAGDAALGNSSGVYVTNGATNNTIGGTAAGAGNVIAFNSGAGISIDAPGDDQNSVRQNRLIGNAGLGIDVGLRGVTPNDPGDTDGYINAPVITSASIRNELIDVRGFARPGSIIEFYVAGVDPSGFGQGTEYIGTGIEGSQQDGDPAIGSYSSPLRGLNVGSDTTSAFHFTLPVPPDVAEGSVITAVTVGISTSTTPAISEFSANITADAGAPFGAPAVNAGGDATITEGANFTSTGSFTDLDSFQWTAEVDYGDGNGFQPLSLNPVTYSPAGDGYTPTANGTFDLAHVYSAAGVYHVVVEVTDDSGLTGLATLTVTVDSAPPTIDNSNIHLSPTIIDENQSVSLTGTFADASPADSHTVQVIWGDGQTSFASVDEAAMSFSATHQYLDDSPKNTASDVYPVEVIVTDSTNGQAQSKSGLFDVQVNNVRPSNLQITPSATAVAENSQIGLSGSFFDPGTLDRHTVSIDWGDGSSPTLLTLAPNVLAFSNIGHIYLNNPVAPATSYQITVNVADDDEPLNPVTATTDVTVTDVSATNLQLFPSATTLTEGGALTLGGSFFDPGTLDQHVATIDWGDGATPQVFPLAAGVQGFSGIMHAYLDNPPSQPHGGFTVTVTLNDPAEPAGTSAVASFVETVNNVPPSVTSLSLLGADGLPLPPSTLVGAAGQINENSGVILDGSYADPGILDRHVVTVFWGDGTSSPASVDATHRTFAAQHTYLDNPPGAPVGLFAIHVSVTDNDGESNVAGNGNIGIAVANLAPEVTILSGGATPAGNPILVAEATDPSPSDQPSLVYSWTINGMPSGSGSTQILPPTFSTSYAVSLTVTDKDGGLTSSSVVVTVLDNSDNVYQVPDPGPGFDSVLVFGLGGNDVIAAGTLPGGVLQFDSHGVPIVTNPLNIPVVLDGDTGTDTLIGGNGDDVLYLHQGNDNGYGLGGNDTYMLTPNSTLTVVDGRGQNTLNFSSSDFGVTFNLTDTSGQLQDVNPIGAPNQHFLSVNDLGTGQFGTLVGSGFADTLTAASNSSVYGGAGNDSFFLGGSGTGSFSNVLFDGGADADTLTVTAGTAAGNITFSGDDGAGSLINNGVLSGTIVYSGGADADTFTNNGVVLAPVTFNGDDGANTFTNNNALAGLIMNGGADADTFVNNIAGAVAGTFVFNGDDGANSFTNNGTIGAVTYNGGADADTFTNLGTVTAPIVFNGDDGANNLSNNGASAGITYNGGADADTFVNNVTTGTTGPIVFNGDDGANNFINNGTITAVAYSGGADADTFTNAASGTIAGSITFSGDDGANNFVNSGAISAAATVRVNGGADADTFTNTAGGVIKGTIVFNGDDGANNFVNSGTVGSSGNVTVNGGSDADTFTNMAGGVLAGTVVFNGDDGANTLTNAGAIVGSVTYNGGADADTFVNAATGTSTTQVVFNGDNGADTLVNLGSLAAIQFNGGADGDTLLNAGIVTGTINFTGGADANTLVNGAVLNGLLTPGAAGSIVFNGGADTDTLYNPGTVTGTITFHGDDGANNLLNTGPAGSINFMGGADADTFTNTSTAQSIVFNGDSGADTLINTGTVQTIAFNGDQGADQFLNQGNNVGSIVFTGGADANLFVNEGNNVSSIMFTGGADADVLSNSGTNVASITFNGDDGANTLINTGAGANSAIVFNGGADSDTLINSASVASIAFYGDQGADTFVNSGSGIQNLTFNGGADANALLNTGNNVAAIVFSGGADADVLRNDGESVGTITFSGDDGSNYFLNTGAVTTVNDTGGADADTFVNTGSITGTGTLASSFRGDDGTNTFYNTASGSAAGIVYTGGADADTLINAGTLNGVTFNGDDGANTLANTSTGALIDVTFTGGADADTLLSNGSLTAVTFNGDDGANVMVLSGPVNTSVVFNGGADADTLTLTSGAGVNGITFDGGADADVLVNSAAGASNITFNGGADADTFWNLADQVTNITFNGDTGADTFVNAGNGATGIVFSGGADSNTLTNTGNNVGTIVYTGGADADTLTNSGDGVQSITFQGDDGANTLTNTGANVGSIVYTGGADTDTLTNSGTGVQLINFGGDDGANSLTNTASGVATIIYTGGADADTLTNSGNGVQTITFNGDDGPNSLVNSGTGIGAITFNGGASVDTLILQGSAVSVNFQGGAGDDLAWVVGAVAGNVVLNGGAGNDSYKFSGTPQGNYEIDDAYTGATDTSIDTLDFSQFQTGGITLDLALTTPQPQGGGFTIDLSDTDGIENVVGTQMGDTIWGNDRDNTITGSALVDTRLDPTPLNAPSPYQVGTRTQWVLFDFDTYTAPGDHIYTPSERAAIMARVEGDYIGPDPSHPWLNVQFTMDLSDIPANLYSAGQYATEYFNRTPPFDRPGGESSEVDLGNVNLGGFTYVQVNGLLGGSDQPPASSDNFVLLSAKIAAHELGHLMGIRHSDAFGPIGSGVHTPPGSDKFTPNPEPAAAFETFDHLISSPATDGSDRFNDLGNLYFGPREAVKLAFADHGTTLPEQPTPHNSVASAQRLPLAGLAVPNMNQGGTELGMSFQVGLSAVFGSIGIDPATHQSEEDYYSFTGRKGDLLNFEVDSVELGRLGGQNTIDSVISVYDSSGNLVPYYGGVAVNDDQFETTDSLLDDVLLPADGTYYVKVTTFSRSPSDTIFDPTNPTSPLNPSDLSSVLNPLNPNFSQSLLDAFMATKTNTATGQYELFVYRFNQVNPTDQGNYISGRAGNDTLIAYSGHDVLIGGPGNDHIDNGTGGPGYSIVVTPTSARATVPLGTTFNDSASFTDPSGAAFWTVTIDYGDGSTPSITTLPTLTPFNISHNYTSAGNFTVLVSVQNDDGLVGQVDIPIQVINHLAPSVTITSPSSGAFVPQGASVGFSASLANPYAGTPYLVTWTAVDTSTNPAQTFAFTQTVTPSSSTGPFTIATTQVFSVVGVYTFQVTVLDETTQGSTTVSTIGSGGPAATFNVYNPNPTITLVAPNAPFTGQPYLSASVAVTGFNGQVISSPAATLTYYSGSTASGTPLAGAPRTAGAYTVVATFAGSTDYTAASAQTTFSISQHATASTVMLSNPAAQPNQAVTFTATVGGGLPAPNIPTGTVQFMVDGQPYGAPVALNASGSASITWSSITPGVHNVVAVYSGDTNFAMSTSAIAKQSIAGSGVSVIGTTLYVVGANTADAVQVNAAGSKSDGSTGLQVVATLNGAAISTTFKQTFTAIVIVGYNGNDNIQLAPGITLPTSVNEGNGNDAVALGGGNDVVVMGTGSSSISGGAGNKSITTQDVTGAAVSIRLGDGNNAIVVGDGTDSIQLGNGSNNVTAGNGNVAIQVGNGDNVVVEGNGTDSVQAGNGANFIVAGLGQHTIQVGNGNNILVDGSVTLTQPGDTLRKILSDWKASASTTVNTRIQVVYNASYPNVLNAGSGRNWWFYAYSKDVTNRKASDRWN
jgi:hypothetical protein